MFKNLKRLIFFATVAVAAAGIAEQLRRPAIDRTWHGEVLGIPYDFRPPSPERFFNAWWNPDEPRLFLPRDFGVGWSINVHRLIHLTQKHSD